MFLPDLVIRSRRVVMVDQIRPAAIHIRHGKIIGVLDFDNVPPPTTCAMDEAAESVVMAGLVDTNVRISRSRRMARDGFQTVTRAAASGGVTTMLAASPGVPATTTAHALEETRGAAERECFVDVGFLGGLVPDNLSDLPALVAAGAFGFTCALARPCLSDVGELPPVSEADLRAALPVISRLGVPLLVHAELPGPSLPPARQPLGGLRRLLGLARLRAIRYATYLSTRPKEMETRAVELLIHLCHDYRTPIHILHLSSADALAPLYHARAARLPISAETCPHYLHFAADEIPDGATEFACAPPIRERENRELLWAALRGGVIQMVVTDHSPCGISSLALGLAVTWTAAASRQCSPVDLARWMCRAPARLAGLDRKGTIDVGYDADLVIWDPETEFTVDPAALEPSAPDGRQPVTPYAGRRLRGVVQRTYLAGARAYERGAPMPPARGRLLARAAAPQA